MERALMIPVVRPAPLALLLLALFYLWIYVESVRKHQAPEPGGEPIGAAG